MALYSEKVMDHFLNPRNVGTIENPSGVGRVGNPVCGDVMQIEIRRRMTVSRTSNSKPSVVPQLSPPAA